MSVTDQTGRSQLKNKGFATEKLLKLLKDALTVQKKRKKRGIPAAVKAKRLEDKKRNSEKKMMREKPRFD